MKTKQLQKKRQNILLILLIILSLSLTICGLLILKPALNKPLETKITNTSPLKPINPIGPDSNGWMKITLPALKDTTYKQFSLSYPNTWSIVNASDESLIIKNGVNTIELTRPAIGGGICRFPDTDMTKLDNYWQDVPIQKEFKQINIKSGSLRRYKQTSSTTNSGLVQYLICELYKNGKAYEIPISGGNMSITMSNTASESEQKEIDSILATYQYE